MSCSTPALDEHVQPASGWPEGNRAVLLALAPGGAIAATEVARRFGATPEIVGTCVDALRAAGLPVRSPRPGWYQLPWPVQLLDVARIRSFLPLAAADRPGMIEVHYELDSTSSELQRRGRGLPDLACVLAETQSAGRGRRGRQWLSPPGLNIQMSCLKRFACGIGDLAGLSLVVGLSVLRTLEALGIHDLGMKWPNDLLARSGPDAGGKLAGMLVELSGGASGPCTAIIGVGLNLRLTAAMRVQVTQAVADVATLHAGTPPDRNRVAAGLMANLVEDLQHFERAGLAPFRASYARHDLLLGQSLQLVDGLGQLAGVGAGIDARGALRVQLADGSVRVVDSAEISVRRS